MNYKQLGIRPLTEDLKQDLISYIKKQLAQNTQSVVTYGTVESENKDSIAYIPSIESWEKEHGTRGSVAFYAMPWDLQDRLKEYYQDINHPLFYNNKYSFQVIQNASHVPPHIDDRHARKEGVIYLLEAGGDNVETTWYDPNEGSPLESIPDKVAIPYSNLNEIESHILKEDCWHYMAFNKVHGVKNLKSARLAINFGPQ